MKYILLIYGDEQVWAALSPDEMKQVYAAHGEYGAAMTRAGVMRSGFELKPVATARSIRFTDSQPLTVDGPFAETEEQLAGYYVIEVDTDEEALAWAQKMPGMTDGTVEVRPVAEG